MSDSTPFILITGFMCVGKSTIGAALARLLETSFLDLDQFIAAREGESVPAIINRSGEEHFRRAETRALHAVLSGGLARIVALGGGTWTIPRNRELIRERGGMVVWLDAPFELCWERIERAADERPLARERTRAQELFQARRVLYEQADLRVQVNEEKSTDETVAEIAKALRRKSKTGISGKEEHGEKGDERREGAQGGEGAEERR